MPACTQVTHAPQATHAVLNDFQQLLGTHIATERPALITPEGEPISLAALHRASACLASGLRQRGVGPGVRVALCLPSSWHWLALFFACTRLGAVVVALNPRAGPAELHDALARTESQLLVCGRGAHGIDGIDPLSVLAAFAPQSLPSLRQLVLHEGAGASPAALPGWPVTPLATLAQQEPDSAPSAGEDACILFSTSGTSGLPKFVLHGQAALLAHAADAAQAFAYGAPDSCVLVTAPFCGVFGFCNALAALVAGCPLVTLPVFRAAQAVALVAAHGVTHANAPSDAISAMLAQPDAGQRLRSLRVLGFAAFSGSAELLAAQALDLGLRLRLVGLYGSSELQALLARQAPDSPDRLLAGGVLVAAAARVRAVDPVSRLPLALGEVGELEIFAPSRMLGYFGNPGASQAACSSDGFFRTGDLGYAVSAREFVFLARLGDTLRLSGFLVNPREIEQCLEALPAVSACQVVAVEAAQGLRPVAFVTLRAGQYFDEQGALAHCQAQLAKYKWPLRVWPLEAFPSVASANATKVRKQALRDLAQARLAAALASAAQALPEHVSG